MDARPLQTNSQLGQLAKALSAVERMAGQIGPEMSFGPIETVYSAASPIARHRHDRTLQRAAAWAASGVEALIASAQAGRPVEPAAARLAEELREAIDDAVAVITQNRSP